MELPTIGIDLGKTVFHLVGLNLRGEVGVRKKFSRKQLLHFTANLQVKLIGMEACGGAHFLGRALREQGHEVGLMPAQYVKPYLKTNRATTLMPRRLRRQSNGRRCASFRSRAMTNWI
jgi:transposase